MKAIWFIMKTEKITKYRVCSHKLCILSPCTARNKEDWKTIYFMQMQRLTSTSNIWCLPTLWALILTSIKLEHWHLPHLLMVQMIILIWHQLIQALLTQTKENKSHTITQETLDTKVISEISLNNYRMKTFKWAPLLQTMSTATTQLLSLKMLDLAINILEMGHTKVLLIVAI